jgi:uroporphyrinogen decarboxylase
MTSCEIVKRTIDFAGPARLAFDCFAYGSRHTDIITSYLDWEFQYERKSWIQGNREYYLDAWGNTWARVVTDKSTKGEIFRGVLRDSWDALDSLTVPKLASAANNQRVRELFEACPDMFKVGCIYNGSFSILSWLRGFENLMEDLLLQPQRIRQACELIDEELTLAAEGYAACGADGLHIMEDWGTQNGALISRKMWEDLFAPGYRKLCAAAHRHDMRVILHSCGMIRALIPALIESGIDVLQFDQTANYGSDGIGGIERLAAEFGQKVTFFCPVDIQHTLVTGDPAKIEDEVRRLVQCLGGKAGGFIAKSYGRGC